MSAYSSASFLFFLGIFLSSSFSGLIGALMGIGGGLILIPILTLFFNIPIHFAAGCGLISVIASSSASAAAYVRDRLSNIRVGLFLETATTAGALLGVYLSGIIDPKVLFFIFGFVLFHSAYALFKKGKTEAQTLETGLANEDPIAKKLKLGSHYFDPKLNREVHYTLVNVIPGYFILLASGVLSALLGIGSGAFKVLAMDRVMGMPIKASSATSNFMIGVTAAASAGAYYMRGDLHPLLVPPVALGVLVGATLGARILPKVSAEKLRKGFAILLFVVAIQMIYKGVSWKNQ